MSGFVRVHKHMNGIDFPDETRIFDREFWDKLKQSPVIVKRWKVDEEWDDEPQQEQQQEETDLNVNEIVSDMEIMLGGTVVLNDQEDFPISFIGDEEQETETKLKKQRRKKDETV